MAQKQTSKYKNVNYKSMRTSATNALKELSSIESNLAKVKDDLSNPANIPSGISTVILTALNFTTVPIKGTGSLGALKNYMSSLKNIANVIETLQKKWDSFEELQKKIKAEKAKKGTDEYNRDYYNSLVKLQNSAAIELLNLESKVDSLVRGICS